ncbi:MAG: hypothetical protein NXI30_28180 [bacterium]|nr:hypothetical protein [bacterium]
MDLLWLLLAIAALVAVFATTRPGRDAMKRIGLRDRVPGAAPTDDVAYLLSICGGDRVEAARCVEAERDRFPDLTEADHYRRAIRKGMAEREGMAERGGTAQRESPGERNA